MLAIIELKNFRDSVESEVKETKVITVLETSQESNLILAQVKSPQIGKEREACNFSETIIGYIKLLDVHVIKILYLRNVVAVK